MSAAVELLGIEKRYGANAILKSADLSIAPGEFLTLVGPSGCGKSTLLRIIAGLLPQTAGSVRIDGAPVDHLPPKARDVSMVFQSYALYPHMTVGQNISVPLETRRLPAMGRWPLVGRLWPGTGAIRREIAAEVARIARQLEIEALLTRKPVALSGGQRQRVALARSIVRHPKVFLMDEPLSNLDASLRVSMRGEIASLHARLGATFVYVTHDQVEAMTMSSRVALMMDGEIVQCAPPQTLYDDPGDIRVARFIGSPTINIVPAQALTAVGLAAGGQEASSLAFRPEDLRIAGAAGDLRLVGRIMRSERLGHNILLHMLPDAGAHKLVARLTPADYDACDKADERITLYLSPQKLLAFNPAGRRVAWAVAAREARRVG